MQFRVSETEGLTTMIVQGEVDAFDVQHLNRVLLRNLAHRRLNIALDLSGAGTVDPSLGPILVQGYSSLRKSGGHLKVLLPKDFALESDYATTRETRDGPPTIR